MAVHRNIIHKVAIVDFDVHHGNGTEACVQAVVPQPWTESVETPTGSVSASGVTYKPWLGPLDKERIFFASIHGYGADAPPGEAAEYEGPMGAFYPGSGGPNSSSTDVGVGPIVRNVPVRLRTRSAAWRREMLTQMLIPLRSFAPDLILVSAGFDAHAHDALEAGGLHDRDYVWMTSELVRIAEACAQGRLVSVLEGGYQVAGGFVSSLARAVGSHVSALTQPSLLGATWRADEATERLEAALKFEDAWQTNRLAMMEAKAKGSAGGSAAPAPPEQDNGAPARRSKRPRGTVDYGALEATLQEEEGGEVKKPKGEEAEE
jgi:predicted pyridoxine 5'-phosphate oxidase superfamily flavin-nucleotide-binding protein